MIFRPNLAIFVSTAYQDRNDNNLHLALTMGNVGSGEPVLVRVHARNLLDDVFSSKRSDRSIPMRVAMQKVAQEGRGVLVVIRQNESNKSLVELIHRYQLEDHGVASPSSAPPDWRMTGTGARILSDLGVHKLKVLGAQKKYVGLAGFDLEVTEHVSCADWESNEQPK